MNQSDISKDLDNWIHPFLIGTSGMCEDIISKMVCHYFFAPCGANGSLHLPLSVCPEECRYVQSACADQWTRVNNLLSRTQLGTINCSATGALLQGLTPCCVDAGIEVKGKQRHKLIIKHV